MKKINYQMLILQTIGIVLVVVGHVGGIGLFSDWFPIGSFHMPLFVFISGYFYKNEYENCMGKFIIKKIKRLVIPYFAWNIFYGVIINIINTKMQLNVWVGKLNFEFLFLEPWKTGHQFSINVAAWFVLSLFLVEVVTILFRKIVSFIKIKNEYIIFFIVLIAGLIGVFYADGGYNTGWHLTIVRMLFLLPFYQFGFLYKSKLECNDKLSNLSYFSLLFVVQYIFFRIYKGLDMSVVFCQFNKNSIIQPYLISLTGILFWLRISRILVPSLGKSRIVYSVGRNTWSIMMHHQFVFFVINCIFYKTYRIFNLNGFEIDKFKSSIWYTYTSGDFRSNIFYVFAGIMIPVLIGSYFNVIKQKVLSCNEKNVVKKFRSKSEI